MISYAWVTPNLLSNRNHLHDINKLLKQLTESARPLDPMTAQVIAQCSLWRVAIEDNSSIKGMATMTISHIPTGKVGHLDDVVVDASLRGQGVGEELIKHLLERAKEQRVHRVELTCKPLRAAANRLYQRLGFQQRETNCYTLKL